MPLAVGIAAAISSMDLGLLVTETVSLRARGLDLSTRSRSFLRSVVQLAVRFNSELDDFLIGDGTVADLLIIPVPSTRGLIGCGALI